MSLAAAAADPIPKGSPLAWQVAPLLGSVAGGGPTAKAREKLMKRFGEDPWEALRGYRGTAMDEGAVDEGDDGAPTAAAAADGGRGARPMGEGSAAGGALPANGGLMDEGSSSAKEDLVNESSSEDELTVERSITGRTTAAVSSAAAATARSLSRRARQKKLVVVQAGALTVSWNLEAVSEDTPREAPRRPSLQARVRARPPSL